MSSFAQTSESPGAQASGIRGGSKAAIFIEYYTDPLCSWSWAFEAQWRRLRYEYGEQLEWRYRMGGLLADWRSYDDPLNDIHSPAQMGPQWFQVRELSGMPLDERIWQVDPPDSSYPACLAVKAAELQGQEVAEHYLRRLREAALLERRNIARQEELYALAQEVAQRLPAGTLDVERLRADLAAPALLEAFRHDLREAAYTGIGRFPTLILHHRAGHSLILVGYRPYDALLAALEHLAPALPPGPAMVPQELARDYIQRWERVTAREVAEILERTTEQTTTLLESLVAEGNLAHAQETQSSVPLYIPVCR